MTPADSHRSFKMHPREQCLRSHERRFCQSPRGCSEACVDLHYKELRPRPACCQHSINIGYLVLLLRNTVVNYVFPKVVPF